MNKEFDIVVHGATGFTGRLVVEYLMARYPQGAGATVRWAMGGRSAEKLAAVRDEIGAPRDTPLVVTDGTDVASLRALTDRTRLVLTTVGPYQLYGNELVAACAASGTDYVDLCGEPVWMRDMIDAHEAQAKASDGAGATRTWERGFSPTSSEPDCSDLMLGRRCDNPSPLQGSLLPWHQGREVGTSPTPCSRRGRPRAGHLHPRGF